MNVLILNGPNLNMLGAREPEIYGYDTLREIEQRCKDSGAAIGMSVECKQSNHEGQLVDWIQQAVGSADALIINAGAYTHTSIALHDALKIFSGYKIELHISNPHLRESFRHVSYVSKAVDAVIVGVGTSAYVACLETLPEILAS
ncbi:MAG: type II 3-dehydroquinate dehydratase [Pseudomonadales bacterium]